MPNGAAAIGRKRRFFSTSDTVDDLEAVRRSLGVGKLTLDGVSYGTYVAELYALRYPQHVAGLVLDSVVPHVAFDPLSVADAHASARVLRAVCRAERCGTDPAQDLAVVVRRRAVGLRLLDTLVTMSVADPSFPRVAPALHEVQACQREALEQAHVAGGLVRTPHLLSRAGPVMISSRYGDGVRYSTYCATGLR